MAKRIGHDFRAKAARRGLFRKSALLVATLGISLSVPANAEGFLRADGTRIVDGKGAPVQLRGMGLGGWMLQEGYMLRAGGLQQHVMRQKMAELIGEKDAANFYRLWLDNFLTKADIDALAGWGFNSVRVALHYDQFTLPVEREAKAGGQTWNPEGFERLDRLIGWSRANGIHVILDMHAAPGGQGNDLPIADRDPAKPSLWRSKANQDKLVALWLELAKRYRNDDTVGGYDLINEPNWDFSGSGNPNGCKETDNSAVENLQKRIAQTIRTVDTNHLIFVEGNCWGGNYAGMKLDWDSNLAISFHRYWNNTSVDTIQSFLDLSEKFKKPLWMGESGENSNDWFAKTIRLLETNDIGWSWWPVKKFGYSNPAEIKPNAGVAKVTRYWLGEGPRPTAAEARAALLQLAEHDVRFENNRIHPDVVDAILRQPLAGGTRPYRDHRVGPEGLKIAAVDYDMGENGVAYFDTAAADYHSSDGGPWVNPNNGLTYRNDGVDISGADGVYFITDVQPGEWWRYTISLTEAGAYDIGFHFANNRSGKISLSANGKSFPVASQFPRVSLQPGRNVLVVRAASAGMDLANIEISKSK